MKKLILSTILFCFLATSYVFAQSVTITPTTDKQLTLTAAGVALPNITGQRSDGTSAAPTALPNGAWFMSIYGRGYNGSGYSNIANSAITFGAAQNFTPTANGSDIQFYTTPLNTVSPQERMRVNHDGNVGIGTTAPATTLDVRGSAAAITVGTAIGGGGALYLGNPSHGVQRDASNDVMLYTTSGILYLSANGKLKNQFMLTGTGNVGIGTTFPGAKLEVVGDIKITGGTPGAGKILTSDASGLASWQTAVTHSIGESYGGGIVFYVYDNGQHGLIAAPTDQSTGIQWYNGTDVFVNATRTGILAGILGTERIIIAQGVGNYAAQVCAAYNGGGFGNWYLPHTRELELLYAQKAIVGGFSDTGYWNCGEISATHASFIDFTNGGGGGGIKSTLRRVRAIRAF